MKNWIGLKPHPTDEYIHWSEAQPQKTAEKLRKAWDSLAYHDEDSLVVLMREAYHLGKIDESEDREGEDI